MRLIGDTIKGFIQRSRTKKVIIGVIISFVILITIDLYIDFLNFSLSFIVEIIAVFTGLYLGFDFTRYMDNRKFNRESRKIYILFIDELEDNKRNMVSLYKSGGVDYMPYLLKHTVWDIYHIKLGDFSPPNIDDLTDIYHNIKLINDNIKHRPEPQHHKRANQVRYKITETNLAIDEWIKKIRNFYDKINPIIRNDRPCARASTDTVRTDCGIPKVKRASLEKILFISSLVMSQ
jgi:hypothetical protein